MANEKRLIYANSGTIALEYMKKHITVGDSDFLAGYLAGVEALANGLEQLPPVDAVEVKDIKLHYILIDQNGIPEVKLQFGERVLKIRCDNDPVKFKAFVNGEWVDIAIGEIKTV